MQLLVEKLDAKAIAPQRQSGGAAGYDLSALEELIIGPWQRAVCRTGIAVQIPNGCYGRVAPRSSLALRGLDVMAGVIDADYRGEIKVLLINLSEEPITIQAGERCAQLILEYIALPEVSVVDRLDITERGQGGFGSTNK